MIGYEIQKGIICLSGQNCAGCCELENIKGTKGRDGKIRISGCKNYTPIG